MTTELIVAVVAVALAVTFALVPVLSATPLAFTLVADPLTFGNC